MSEKKKGGPAVKSKGKKLPAVPAWPKSDPSQAPDSNKKSMPHANAPAEVSGFDGDGQKIQVSSDLAKDAPSSKGSKKSQGEGMEMPKPDSDGRHY